VNEMIFLIKGNMSYVVEGKVYPLRKNDLLLTRPGDTHTILANGTTEYARYCILFDASKFPSRIYENLSPDIPIVNLEGNPMAIDLFHKIHFYCQNFQGEQLDTILLHLMEEALCQMMIVSRQTDPDTSYTANATIHKAITYIDQNLTQPLTLDMLCDELYVSKVYLHQLFIKHLQISPKKYITNKKLMLAQKELRSGKKSTEVFQICGFTDYSTFYRDYKKLFGYSPSQETSAKTIWLIQS